MFEIFPIDMTSPSLASSNGLVDGRKVAAIRVKILKEFSSLLKDIEDRLVSELEEKKHREAKLRESLKDHSIHSLQYGQNR
ncbi:unnamed protein product [Brassica oleracea]